jgi:3-methylcrotonyl-CoA carboxylase alpha subunit
VLLSEQQRELLFDAAIEAGRAVNYVGAGTVEFILDKSGAVYFIEMNTRLQVEHPVTERVTGLDLVEWQLRVAAGEQLPLMQSAITCRGHAVEVRVYAEDPAQDFRPSTGEISHLRLPKGANVRVDSGVAAGDAVTPYYDAMIAKIITAADSRDEALQEIRHALSATEIVGVTTNIEYLQKILAHPGYRQGGFDTHFVEDARADLFPQDFVVPASVWQIAAIYSLDALIKDASHSARNSSEPQSPWIALSGFRLNTPARFEFLFRRHDTTVIVNLEKTAAGWDIECNDVITKITRFEVHENLIQISTDTALIKGNVIPSAREVHVFHASGHYRLQPIDPLHTGDETTESADKLVAPMPGAVMAIMVKLGDKVTRGTPLLVLEAMKIEHTISAPFDGIVSDIRFNVGDQVLAEGVELIKLEASPEPVTK